MAYTLGSNAAERDRLRRQSDDLHDHALTLLDHAALRAGAATLDVGCGPRGTIELLSRRVGPTGRVTGIDINPVHVAMARQLVLEAGIRNLEILPGDARRTGLPSATFDLVHARLLLIKIPRPQEVVAEMTRLTKPGGWIVIEEADAALHLCYPPHPAWDRLGEIFHAVYHADGRTCLSVENAHTDRHWMPRASTSTTGRVIIDAGSRPSQGFEHRPHTGRRHSKAHRSSSITSNCYQRRNQCPALSERLRPNLA